MHAVWTCFCSANSNVLHPHLGKPTHCVFTPICLGKFHPWWCVIGSFKLNIQNAHLTGYKLSCRAYRSWHVLVETRLVFLAVCYTWITRSIIFWLWGHSLIQVTTPICSSRHSSAESPPFVSLTVLTPQQAYHDRLPQDYIDSLTTFTRNIYAFFVSGNHPPCSA